MAERAEAASRDAAAATADAADVRRRADVAEQLRSRADDRVEDYRAQLEEYRRREADRAPRAA
jgi:hypothetical protein